MSNVQQFQRMKDEFFAHDPGSPLNPAQRSSFPGLRYYPHDPALVFTSRLTPHPDSSSLTVPTSDGEDLEYARAGVVNLVVEGQQVQLTLLKPADDVWLFLPFRDATSGRETYGAGRYVNVAAPTRPAGELTVDFNLAFNPYCAYNDGWSCPLPPPENWLPVPIRAGELVFEPAHSRI